jgi:hypothetical protein
MHIAKSAVLDLLVNCITDMVMRRTDINQKYVIRAIEQTYY